MVLVRVCVAAVLLLAALPAAPAQQNGTTTSELAGKRVALVIGNSDYKNTPKLDNPRNDAADMTAALKQLGFRVIEGRDLDKAGMDRSIRDFAEALTGAKVGLMFYAGHGLQVGSENYLVPVDARLTTAAALDFEMVRLDLIHRTMEREAATNIIILDACRDNPLARNLARALGTRSTKIGRGLAPVESGEGTLISFSTQPGNVALDGDGRNSPFTSAFLKHIVTPGEDLPSILISVRNDVMTSTQRRQVPWEHSALTSKFYFTPPKMTVEQQMEATYWDAVKNSSIPGPIARYLERYPNGANAALAKALIDQLEKDEAAERLARDADQRRLEAELKRLDEDRKAAEAQRLEARRQADEMRKSAEAQVPQSKAEGTQQANTRYLEESAERDRQLKLVMQELLRAREAAEAADAQRLAAQKEALEAVKSAEAAKAAAAAEAKRRGEKVASLPGPGVQPGAPFDGAWRITASSTNCSVKSGSFGLSVSGGRIADGSRRGSVSASGHAQWTQPAVADGAAILHSGTFRGNSGSGTYRRTDGKCDGTFTATRVR